MGTPSFSVPILKAINDSNHKIIEVYSQPPNKKNRGLKVQKSSVQFQRLLFSSKVLCSVQKSSVQVAKCSSSVFL